MVGNPSRSETDVACQRIEPTKLGLKTSLRSFIEQNGGAVPWRSWMESALYDPLHGYYTRNINTVGRKGDFSTSATLTPALGQAIAKWIRAERSREKDLALIEIGPGDGSLHETILQSLGWLGRRGFRSHLVERSPELTKVQQERLHSFRTGIRWHEDMVAALHACEGAALIFSNELVDAFPATLLQKVDQLWYEVWLEIAPNRGIVEVLRPFPAQHLSTAQLLPWPDSQRIEVHDTWRSWLSGWRHHWRSGSMLTIDYGGDPTDIYHRRPNGTVRGYRHHQMLTSSEIYGSMGLCDITADVNFADLQVWSHAADIPIISRQTQAEFLAAWNIPMDCLSTAAESFHCLIGKCGRSPSSDLGKSG